MDGGEQKIHMREHLVGKHRTRSTSGEERHPAVLRRFHSMFQFGGLRTNHYSTWEYHSNPSAWRTAHHVHRAERMPGAELDFL